MSRVIVAIGSIVIGAAAGTATYWFLTGVLGWAS